MTALTSFSSTFRVMDGVTDVTTGHGVVYSVLSEVGCDASINASTGVYTLNSVTSDSARATFKAVYNGRDIIKTFDVAKARQGDDGTPAKLMWVTTTAQTVSYNTDGTTLNPASQDIVLRAYKQGTTATVTFSATDANGVAVGSPQTGDTFTISSSVLATLFNGTTSFKVKATITDGITIEDHISISKVVAGASGTAAKLASITSTGQVYTFDNSTTFSSGSPASIVLTAALQAAGSSVNWTAADASGAVSLTGWTSTGTSLTISQANFGTSRNWLKITATSATDSSVSDTFTIYKVTHGINALQGVLSNEGHTVPTDYLGNGGDFSNATGTFKVYYAGTDVTASATLTAGTATGCTAQLNTATNSAFTGVKGAYRVTAMSADTATFAMSATFTVGGSTLTTSATFSLAKSKAGPIGNTGPAGSTIAPLLIYQRSATTPALPSVTTTYTFATQTFTPSLNNGWTTTIPAANGNPLYVSAATASGNGSSDTIAASEWAAAVIQAQDGTPGANAAPIFLYQRAASVPSVPSTTLTYTFATGVLSGTLGSWSRGVPATNGNPCYVTSATALGTGTTDTISNTEWATPTILAQDGAAGSNNATVVLFQRAASAPSVPGSTLTYTFSTGVVSGTLGSWTQTVPAGTNPLYRIQASASSNTATDTILAGEWSTPVIEARDGEPGPAIVLTPSAGAVTYLNGVTTGSQTITITATLQNVSGTIVWSTVPASVGTAGTTTYTLNDTHFASRSSVVVTATIGTVKQSVTITRQDTLSTEYLSTISYNAADATDASSVVLNVSADGVVSKKEKTRFVIPMWSRVQANYSKFRAEAVARSVSVTAFDAAFTALQTYIASYSSLLNGNVATQATNDFNTYVLNYEKEEAALVAECNAKVAASAAAAALTSTWSGTSNDNGKKPSDNAGVVLDLYMPYTAAYPATIRGTSITGGGSWQGFVSREAVKGACFASFMFDGGLQTAGLLNQIPYAASEASHLGLTIYAHSYSAGVIYLATYIPSYGLNWGFGTCVPGDSISVRTDEVYLHIEKNGVPMPGGVIALATMGWAAGQTLRVGGSIHSGTLSNIKFGPSNDARFDASKMGTLAPENNATVGAQTSVNFKQDDGTVLTQAKVRNTDLVITGSGGALYLTHSGNVAIDNVNLSDAGIAALAYKTAASMDSDVTDGATYARPLASRLSGGKPLIDFSEGIHANKTVDYVADGSTYARPLTTEMTGGVHKLGIAGSGKKLGDARQLPNVNAMNLGYKWPTAPSYTSTTTSATISVPATTLISGSVSVYYNASSVGVSGSPGTIVPYYLYLDDPTNAGGSRTLAATTDGSTVYQSDSRVFVGAVEVSFPTSGTGGGEGEGGGGNCVAADAWVETFDRGFVAAREVQPGDSIRVLAEDMESTDWELVTSNMLAPARGWLLTSASGIKLTLSDATPITLQDRSMIRVDEIDGHELPVQCAKGFRWEPCQAEPVGGVMVAHIRVSQKTYAAGDVPGRSILTHNPFNNPKP